MANPKNDVQITKLYNKLATMEPEKRADSLDATVEGYAIRQVNDAMAQLEVDDLSAALELVVKRHGLTESNLLYYPTHISLIIYHGLRMEPDPKKYMPLQIDSIKLYESLNLLKPTKISPSLDKTNLRYSRDCLVASLTRQDIKGPDIDKNIDALVHNGLLRETNEGYSVTHLGLVQYHLNKM